MRLSTDEATTWPMRALAYPLVALAAYVAVWTLAAVLTYPTLHHDTLETWVWGQHPAFGYFKHPPLSAWLPGLWFLIFPRQDWAFYLLAYLNAAAGLWAVWLIAGRLLTGPSRAAAVLLLGLAPFFTFSAAKLNANVVLLSIWPWTAYQFMRSMDERTARSGALLGVLGALAVLGKYYSVLLVASCFVASILHPAARAYWRSLAPYAAGVALLLALSPHAVWLVQNDFQTFTHAAHTMRLGLGDIIGRGTWAMVLALALHVPAAIALVLALDRSDRGPCLARLLAAVADRSRWWLLALALGPYVLTYAACLVADVRISLQFMIPVFFMWPAVALHLMGCEIGPRGLRGIAAAVIVVALLGIAIAPVVPIVNLKAGLPAFEEPRQQVAAEATRIWRQRYGRPLAIVAGQQGYAEGIAFYSPDAPSELSGFHYDHAPWITPERVRREGLLVVCPRELAWCVEGGRELAGERAESVEGNFRARVWGVLGDPQSLIFILRPPAE